MHIHINNNTKNAFKTVIIMIEQCAVLCTIFYRLSACAYVDCIHTQQMILCALCNTIYHRPFIAVMPLCNVISRLPNKLKHTHTTQTQIIKKSAFCAFRFYFVCFFFFYSLNRCHGKLNASHNLYQAHMRQMCVLRV